MSSTVQATSPAPDAQSLEVPDDYGLQTDSRFSIARDALVNGKPHAPDAASQYLATLDEVLCGFAMMTRSVHPDDDVLRSLARLKPYADQLRWFFHLLARHAGEDMFFTRLAEALGNLLRFKAPAAERGLPDSLRQDHFRFFLWEAFLSLIAVLLREQRWQAAGQMMSTDFHWQEAGMPKEDGYVAFFGCARTLEQFRCRRLGATRGSLSVDLLKMRADLAFLNFDDIVQADFLLCLRRLLHAPQQPRRWFPRTLVLARPDKSLEVFARNSGGRNFAPIATLLGVNNEAQMLERFAAAASYHPERWSGAEAPIPFQRLMALDELETESGQKVHLPC